MTIFVGVAAVVLLTIYVVLIVHSRRDVARQFHVDKQPDAPKPFGYKMAWIAVKTVDGEGLCNRLGLETGMPSNWNSGIGTVYDDGLCASYVYVTPPVEGWTFVVGLGLPHPVGPSFTDKLTPLLVSLSRHYSDVQYYFTYPLIDFFAWARVKDGKL